MPESLNPCSREIHVMTMIIILYGTLSNQFQTLAWKGKWSGPRAGAELTCTYEDKLLSDRPAVLEGQRCRQSAQL